MSHPKALVGEWELYRQLVDAVRAPLRMVNFMAAILNFPKQRARGAVLRNHIETLQNAKPNTPDPVTESIIALMEQIQRVNASIATYMAETGTTGKR
ncbi:hypothetical protein DSM25559_5044 [Agrobacterium rosae]|jgi:hypothetical protein|uniref:Uncharacterized protein n=2 Tax=Agrobacterium rosae TaxID=1972867 RepID=A0A1R3U2T3_9HYPH|nr:hypothetical protein DSM25559_5044 [Agrobacterium rosae]